MCPQISASGGDGDGGGVHNLRKPPTVPEQKNEVKKNAIFGHEI